MLLRNRNAVIYGGGGAIGGAVARAFAWEGANVFLAGRTRARLECVADDIASVGGRIEIDEVDALDEAAIDAHADAVAARAGGIDIALNAIGIPHVQGTPFAELSLHDFEHPVSAYTRSLAEVAYYAAFAASDRGGAMTGVIANLSCGSLFD